MYNVFQIDVGVRSEAPTITLLVDATLDNAETVLFYSCTRDKLSTRGGSKEQEQDSRFLEYDSLWHF